MSTVANAGQTEAGSQKLYPALPHWCQEPKHLHHLLLIFPGHLQESESEVAKAEHKAALIWDVVSQAAIYLLCHRSGPCLMMLHKILYTG